MDRNLLIFISLQGFNAYAPSHCGHTRLINYYLMFK